MRGDHGIPLRAGILMLCLLICGCGGATGSRTQVGRGKSPQPADFHYSVLSRPGTNGISVIAPSQVAAAKRTPAHPIWIRLGASSRRNSARPMISSARELIHAGELRVWLAENEGGGICILSFDPRDVPDPKHDHSLLVFCGSESARGEGELLEERWAHGSRFVVGAVPDGVRLVVLHLANRERREVAVNDNSYHVVVPARVAEVSFSGYT